MSCHDKIKTSLFVGQSTNTLNETSMTIIMVKVMIYLILLATAVLCQTDENLVPIIDTNAGRVSGITLESFSGINFSAYLGIPFAEPPVDDLRFQVCTQFKILFKK